MLDGLIATPRLLEVDRVEIAAPAERIWSLVRHGDLARSPLIHALFALRTLPDRLRGKDVELSLRVDDLRSTPERPGFQVLAEEAPREFAVGAIGKVWQPEIPFVHVASSAEFASFDQPGFIKVAWCVRVIPRGESTCEVELEVRVDATDDDSWRRFQHYFRVIGPASRLIRRMLLSSLARELGTPEELEREGPLPGDELLPDAVAQMTHGITIEAPPERIWPWLLQLGCGRAGFYSIDALDNGGVPSARELHPEFLQLDVGRIIPATPGGKDGFEVLKVDPPRTLALGGLYDSASDRQLPFSAPRPEHYWQSTWVFVLEPLTAEKTRLHVRVRAAFSHQRLRLAVIRPVHHLMQTAMLRHLAQRVEDRLPRDGVSDVVAGVGGALTILTALLWPFGRSARSHWGLDAELAARPYPGDDIVCEPRWSWTHAVEVRASAARVWPWIAQMGADRGGFYSYQWLENLAGCDIRNAETVHPEWQAKVGDELLLQRDPRSPRLKIAALEPGQWLLASAPADADALRAGKPWAAASWLFFIEPLAEDRCRVISRYRVGCSSDLASRLAFGPTLLEPVGFAMDRRMLLGIQQRAEGPD